MLHVAEVSVGVPWISEEKPVLPSFCTETTTSPGLATQTMGHFNPGTWGMAVRFSPGLSFEGTVYCSLHAEVQLRGFE